MGVFSNEILQTISQGLEMDADPFVCMAGLRWRGRNGKVDHSQSYFKNTFNYNEERYDFLVEVDCLGREDQQLVKQTEQAEQDRHGSTNDSRTEIKVQTQTDLIDDIISESDETQSPGKVER